MDLVMTSNFESKDIKGKGLLGLDAIVLIADDFEGQCRFYEEVLGLERITHYGDAVFFRLGNQKLAIFARSHHPEGTKRLGGANHGISHLEFRIDRAEREQWLSRLKAVNAHAYEDNFADADGNLFHFNYIDS
jgi:catechol 2,3-dioxygenase-like lactoylglutathione lyase family enzyme